MEVFLGYLTELGLPLASLARRRRRGRRDRGPRRPSRNAASPATWWPTTSSPRVCCDALEQRGVGAGRDQGPHPGGSSGAHRAPRHAARERRRRGRAARVRHGARGAVCRSPAERIAARRLHHLHVQLDRAAVRGLMEAGRRRRRPAARERLAGAALCSIGPVTSDALREQRAAGRRGGHRAHGRWARGGDRRHRLRPRLTPRRRLASAVQRKHSGATRSAWRMISREFMRVTWAPS